MYSIDYIKDKSKLKESKGQIHGVYCKTFKDKKDIYILDKSINLVHKLTFKSDDEDNKRFAVINDNKRIYTFIDDGLAHAICFSPLVLAKSNKGFIYFVVADQYEIYE